ncbi:MAG: hypothetical protein JWM35_235, partial [Verrucomicrobia bacterium]|nr:hypothetical protein [Verrucomicrobiota bacterium]
PLGLTRWAPTEPPVTFLESGAYRIIFFPNYSGDPRIFSADELCATANGFVAIAEGSDDVSPAKFRRQVLASSLTDYIWDNQRTVQWSGLGHTIELSHGLITNGVRHAAVDGVAVNSPIWNADGLPFARLPFAASGHEPNPKAFPFTANGDRWNEFPAALFSAPEPRPSPKRRRPRS